MRCGLAVLITIMFAGVLSSAAGALDETAHILAADDAETLKAADDRILLLDGLLSAAAQDGKGAAGAAAAALAALRQAAVGRDVRLAPLLEGPDRWGRLPADVYLTDDGAWLQGLMLRAGHARIAACPRGDAERLARLRKAETEARKARRGLWALPAYSVRSADRPMRPAGFALVEGQAFATGGGRKLRYLNFAENWRKDFTLSADRRAVGRLKAAGLAFDSLVGRKIRARGWLAYRNGPMLNITCPQQIEALPP